MPHVRIVHTTEYVYTRPVKPTTHRLMLRPRDSFDLTLRDATLTVSPPAARSRWAHDVFGNSVCYLDWEGAKAQVLRIVSSLDIDHFQTPADLPLDPVAERYPFSYAAEEAPDVARYLERHLPDPRRLVDAWARRFLNQAGPTRTVDMLISMTQAIRADFRYETRDAEGMQTPVATLAANSGACRDFALLMMEAVRSLGLAARFVSGYLYDPSLAGSASPMVGGGATHAWLAVYLPGAGWVEFDPTNGLVAGRNLIRVCTARTPEQAVPIAGGYLGAASDFKRLSVNVEVVVGDRQPGTALSGGA